MPLTVFSPLPYHRAVMSAVSLPHPHLTYTHKVQGLDAPSRPCGMKGGLNLLLLPTAWCPPTALHLEWDGTTVHCKVALSTAGSVTASLTSIMGAGQGQHPHLRSMGLDQATGILQVRPVPPVSYHPKCFVTTYIIPTCDNMKVLPQQGSKTT